MTIVKYGRRHIYAKNGPIMMQIIFWGIIDNFYFNNVCDCIPHYTPSFYKITNHEKLCHLEK
jgi:hypothetical protein